MIAADCAHHRLHLAEDLVIAEVVDRNNQPVPVGSYGDKLLVTVLFSRTVPLIRYELSDRVALADLPTPCACGKPFAVLAGIQGRVEDTMFLAGRNGSPVAIKANVFHDILEPAPIDGWQVVQESANSLAVSVLGPHAGYDGVALAEKIRSRLSEQGALDVEVHIRAVKALQQSATFGNTLMIRLSPHARRSDDAARIVELGCA